MYFSYATLVNELHVNVCYFYNVTINQSYFLHI